MNSSYCKLCERYCSETEIMVSDGLRVCVNDGYPLASESEISNGEYKTYIKVDGYWRPIETEGNVNG